MNAIFPLVCSFPFGCIVALWPRHVPSPLAVYFGCTGTIKKSEYCLYERQRVLSLILISWSQSMNDEEQRNTQSSNVWHCRRNHVARVIMPFDNPFKAPIRSGVQDVTTFGTQ